ncbi:MAG: hypothetical protein IT456_08230 [Planctomycetes bacterium]|nr:hypothetical protein [Planctomycetota bacterium]
MRLAAMGRCAYPPFCVQRRAADPDDEGMHMPSLAIAMVTLLGTLAAQAPDATLQTSPERARQLPPAAVADLDTVAVDTADPSTLWAAGPTWKASFAADGTLFVPCFGATAPRNFPARLARATVHVGGKLLTTETKAPVYIGDAVQFAGPAFTERYVLSLSGIEQQFVLPTLPNRGAITVDVPFTSELAVQATGGGFRFVGEHGSFGYGRAVAIDAAGRRCELATDRTDRGFRIVVPQGFVANATLPLLIDPLIGAVTAVTTDTKAIASTDIAWHEGMNTHCMVWERVFSATDSDVYARYLDANMQPTGTQLTIDSTLDSWRMPRIAGVGSASLITGKFLVVAQKSTGNVAPFTGTARMIMGTPPGLGTAFALFAPGVEVYSLDVGGDPSGSGFRFCIVAETSFGGSSHDIAAELRDGFGALITSAYLDSSPGLEMAPQISKSCGMPGGNTQGWGIAYLRRSGPSQNQPLFTCVSRNLVPTATAAPLNIQVPALNGAIAVSSPTDDSQGRQYAVIATYDSGSTEYARGGVFDRFGTQVATSGGWNMFAKVIGEPQIDSDGTRFLCAIPNGSPSSANQREVDFYLLGINGTSVSWDDTSSANTTNDVAPSVASRRSGGGPERLYGLGWVENLAPSGARVVGSNFDGIQEGAQFAVRYTSCGGLGFLSSGSTVLGGSVDLMLATNTGLVGWVVGLPYNLALPICPGCIQGADGSAVLGQSYSFAVPRNAAFVGMSISFQGFQFLPTPGNGACLAQINLSNTLDATIR